MSDCCIELPKYERRKVVHALKIGRMTLQGDNSVLIEPDDDRYSSFSTPPGWGGMFSLEQVEDLNSDPGYYVVYEGGQSTWSPTDSFESLYTLVD